MVVRLGPSSNLLTNCYGKNLQSVHVGLLYFFLEKYQGVVKKLEIFLPMLIVRSGFREN